MLKAKEILRLKHVAELSLRDIAKACNCGKTTVAEVLERASSSGIFWPVSLNDKQLISLLYPPQQNKFIFPEPDINQFSNSCFSLLLYFLSGSKDVKVWIKAKKVTECLNTCSCCRDDSIFIYCISIIQLQYFPGNSCQFF